MQPLGLCLTRFACLLILFFVFSLCVELFENPGKTSMYSYPAMTKTMRGAEVPGTPIQTFILHVDKGQFTDSEIVVMLGKPTFLFVCNHVHEE